jgi:hypothetical protein
MFGEQKVARAAIHGLNLVNHKPHFSGKEAIPPGDVAG